MLELGFILLVIWLLVGIATGFADLLIHLILIGAIIAIVYSIVSRPRVQ